MHWRRPALSLGKWHDTCCLGLHGALKVIPRFAMGHYSFRLFNSKLVSNLLTTFYISGRNQWRAKLLAFEQLDEADQRQTMRKRQPWGEKWGGNSFLSILFSSHSALQRFNLYLWYVGWVCVWELVTHSALFITLHSRMSRGEFDGVFVMLLWFMNISMILRSLLCCCIADKTSSFPFLFICLRAGGKRHLWMSALIKVSKALNRMHITF